MENFLEAPKEKIILHSGAQMTGGKGFFGIGIENIKHEHNIGDLWRSAHLLGASFIFTINRRYLKYSSDLSTAWKNIPLFHFDTIDDLVAHLPYACPLVGVEMTPNSRDIVQFIHRDICCYLLGAENRSLTIDAQKRCHMIIQLPGDYSMNVAAAGTVVMYDRIIKQKLVETLLQ